MENNFEKRYQVAKQRVKDLKDFYVHLTVYLVVISFLAFINLYWSSGYLWFLWPAAGWGVGLLFQAASVYRINPFFDKNWEERKLKQYLEEEEKRDQEIQERWE